MMYAARSETLWLRLLIAALAVLLTLAGWTAGSEPWRKPLPTPDAPMPRQAVGVDLGPWSDVKSNRPVVRQALNRGAVLVTLGAEWSEQEFRALKEALADPLQGGSVTLREEAQALRDEVRCGLTRHLGHEGGGFLALTSDGQLYDALRTAVLTGGRCRLQVRGIDLEVGLVTYHQQRIRGWVESRQEEGFYRVISCFDQIRLPVTRQCYARVLAGPDRAFSPRS